MEDKLKKILFIIAILILIVINIVIYLYYNNSDKDLEGLNEEISYYDESFDKNTNEIISEAVNNKIANMDEAGRAKIYFGKFIEAIEDNNYELAYSYLNETYKSNYFPTLEQFTEYTQNKYPKNDIIVNYNSIERKGEIFVMEVTINDEEDMEFQEFSQSVVIRENSINNFAISFSKEDERSGRSK